MDQLSAQLSAANRQIDAAAGRAPADLVLKDVVYVNVFSGELLRGDIAIVNERIVGTGTYSGRRELHVEGIVCPGFTDAHIHLESSLACPAEFARAVVPHGTTCVVTDPHEITNVMGTAGIDYMLQATRGLPLDVFFMLPSCVPATPLDESGALLDWFSIDPYYEDPRVLGLAEMMNAFGVVHNDDVALRKILSARRHGKRVDGHAPGLTGPALNAYVGAGVGSDHECASLQEGLEKLRLGQYIMIRDGTAARNLEALAPLLQGKTAERCLLCTDDKHPNDLLEKGHIDEILRRAVGFGADPLAAVTAATRNAAQYFGLTGRGAIAPGYLADLTVVEDLESFRIRQVYKNGRPIYDGALLPFSAPQVDPALLEDAQNSFHVAHIRPEDFAPKGSQGIIGLMPGQITSTDNGRADRPDPSETFSALPWWSGTSPPVTSVWVICRATGFGTGLLPPPSPTTPTTSS